MTDGTILLQGSLGSRRIDRGDDVGPTCRFVSDWKMFGLLVIALMNWALMNWQIPLVAQDQDSAADGHSTRCKLQSIRDSTQEMMRLNSPISTMPRDGLSDNYERDVLATDWYIEPTVDPMDARLRCLLMTPATPLIVDLLVYIDGQPFRSLQEAWIDQAVQPPVTIPAQTDAKTSVSPQEENAEDVAPPRAVSTALKRLIQHVANRQSPLEREEARWLLAQSLPGPQILELNDGISTQRASIDPLMQLLDSDGDGHLNEPERREALSRLTSADANRDSVLELNEIQGALPKKLLRNRTIDRKTLWFARRHDWDGGGVATAISEWYPAARGELTTPQLAFLGRLGRENGSWPTAMEWDSAALTTAFDALEADIVVRIDFGESPQAQPGVTLQSLRQEWGPVTDSVHVKSDVLAIDLGLCHLEFFAAQRTTRGSDAEQAGQVSVGAVLDGFTLYRQADADSDQSLSNNEQAAFVDQLNKSSANTTDMKDSDAFPLPIRMGVALGPYVHELFAQPSPAAINKARGSTVPQSQVPGWFVSMDTNSDHYLTPAEFLGTPEQFGAFDQNGDQQIDAKESAQNQQQ